MSLEQRTEKVKKARACYRCLKIGHNAKHCRSAQSVVRGIQSFYVKESHHKVRVKERQQREHLMSILISTVLTR
jgi:hypothetical protein